MDIASRGDRLPLSFAQQRLWFLDQLEPGSARYNVAHALQITGCLDAQTLQRSLSEIVKRHESLRTVFTVIDGQPSQKILPIVTVELPVIDLREIVARANQSLALQQVIAEEAHRPFDLACGPLIRCKLLVLGEEQYVLLLTLHHIAFDGWSGTVLEREALGTLRRVLKQDGLALTGIAFPIRGLCSVAGPFFTRTGCGKAGLVLEKAISESFETTIVH